MNDLEQGQYFNVGTLPDKSIVAVKKMFFGESNGDYSILRRMPGGTDFTDIILEDDYITFEPAKERAIIYFNTLKEELK
jgi:hypothetical protein